MVYPLVYPQIAGTANLLFISILLGRKLVQVPSSAGRKKESNGISHSALFGFLRKPQTHGFKVSASLRSAQNRGPPDLVRPIFRCFRSTFLFFGFLRKPQIHGFKVSPVSHTRAGSVGSAGKRSTGPFSGSASPHLPRNINFFGFLWKPQTHGFISRALSLHAFLSRATPLHLY